MTQDTAGGPRGPQEDAGRPDVARTVEVGRRPLRIEVRTPGVGMTWGQFKAAVERGGVRDQDPVHYVDAHVSLESGVCMAYSEALGWAITSAP